MRKRSWTDSGLEDLGVSTSLLKNLDIVEGINDDLSSVNEAIDLTAHVRGTEASLNATERVADLNATIETASLKDITSANTSVRAAEAIVPRSSIEIAKDRIIGTKATLGQINTGLGIGDLWSNAGVPMFPTARKTMLGGMSFTTLFGAEANLSHKPSTIPSIINGIGRFNNVTKLHPSEVLSPKYNIQPLRSAIRTMSSILGAGQRQRSFLTDSWHGGFSSKTLKDIFGTLDTITSWSTAMPLKDHWMFELNRKASVFETSMGNLINLKPSLGLAAGRVGGILEVLGRIDWGDFERALRVQEARRPRTRIGYAALNAYDELYMGHPRVADQFLIEYLGIKPSEETRAALWIVLGEAFERTTTEPATWITLDDKKATSYLCKAVYNEASRIRRDQEMEDRIWWPEGEKEKDEDDRKLSKPALGAHGTLDFLMRKSPSPEELMIPPQDPRGQVLQMLYFKGTEQDKKVVGMLIVGFDLPDIAEVLGWTEVQRFQRKAQRWIRIKI